MLKRINQSIALTSKSHNITIECENSTLWLFLKAMKISISEAGGRCVPLLMTIPRDIDFYGHMIIISLVPKSSNGVEEP